MGLESQFYFAYGSNLYTSRMKERCPDAKFYSRASLLDHQLTFPRIGSLLNCGVAGVAPAIGDCVEGVVYHVSESDITKLDEFEGVAEGAYRRELVTVILPNQAPCTVWIYQATPEEQRLPPSKQYLMFIIQGAEEHGLSGAYVEKLKRIATI